MPSFRQQLLDRASSLTTRTGPQASAVILTSLEHLAPALDVQDELIARCQTELLRASAGTTRRPWTPSTTVARTTSAWEPDAHAARVRFPVHLLTR
jgi:hypothetical protein